GDRAHGRPYRRRDGGAHRGHGRRARRRRHGEGPRQVHVDRERTTRAQDRRQERRLGARRRGMSEPAGGTGAILLAGGRASRMGGVAKPLLDVGGRSLLRSAVDAVRGCAPVTVAAEVLDPALDVDWVREEPPFSGPAAAVVAALASWDRRGIAPEWTLLL